MTLVNFGWINSLIATVYIFILGVNRVSHEVIVAVDALLLLRCFFVVIRLLFVAFPNFLLSLSV